MLSPFSRKKVQNRQSVYLEIKFVTRFIKMDFLRAFYGVLLVVCSVMLQLDERSFLGDER